MSVLFEEYTKAANPKMPNIPIQAFNLSLIHDRFGWIPFDISKQLKTSYPATGPSVLAGYFHVKSGSSFNFAPNSCAVFCYVIEGDGECVVGNNKFAIEKGDVLSLPGFNEITWSSKNSNLVIYSVNDSPLLERLAAAPRKEAFTPLIYKDREISDQLEKIKNEPGATDRNRVGLIYQNKQVLSGKGMSPSVWAATVLVPAGDEAMPHKHNSIAVDIVLDCAEGAFSRLGWQIDENNEIIDAVEVKWEPGAVFITPPGIWHSHHNKSSKPAIVTAVQDATLHEYLETLHIKFTHKGSPA